MKRNWRLAGVGFLFLCAATTAQDSVGKRSCEADMPPGDLIIDKVGDAVDAWDDGVPNEQRNDYIVDLTSFQTSWGTILGIAPIVKSSKTNEDFFGSLISAQGISRLHLTDVSFGVGSSHALWSGPNFGVNNDPSKNDPPTLVDTSGLTGNQFAIMFAEFSTTDVNNSYNGIAGALVRYLPGAPNRLFVSRINAAVNGCDNVANLSQMGVGAVDETGVLHFRADGGTVTDPDPVAAACGLAPFPVNDLIPPSESNQNVFRVNLGLRDPTKRNVISNDFVIGGQFDKGSVLTPTTEWLVRNSAVTHNTPGTGPASVFGAPFVLETNFNNEYVHGTTFGSLTSTLAHLNPVVNNGQRGNISYLSRNCTLLSSTHGIGAVLGKDDPTFTQVMNVFGIGAGGGVTGTRGLVLPANIFDNVVDPGPGPSTGLNLRNAAGDNEHDHYHSQVAFRGGNGQIALGMDQQGNLLVAAQTNHPDSSNGLAHEFNYIVVARVNCSDGTEQWTMAGYNFNGNFAINDPNARIGKAVLNGPNGSTIARMTTLDRVTGGSPLGPSVSAPMIDSVGNVYFVSAVEICNGGICDGVTGPFTNALLRAVYDPAAFGYRLELVFKLGDVFHGRNSDRNYLVSFTGIADVNSVDSATAWSQNISEVAHANGSSANLAPQDPRTLGGLVLAAEIIYDVDNDGDFEECQLNGGLDQDYNVLLYVGSVEAGCAECQLYGDIWPPLDITPPDVNQQVGNCVVDVDDISCVLDGFAGMEPCKTNADINPCPVSGGNIDVDDISAVLDAFAGVVPPACTHPCGGACCSGAGQCSITHESECAGAFSEGVDCNDTPDPCP